MSDKKLLVLLFFGCIIGIGMYMLPRDVKVVWYPFPYVPDLGIHPQSWAHMALWRIKFAIVFIVLQHKWPRFKTMFAVFFWLEIIDVVDFLLRYGKDFYGIVNFDTFLLKIVVWTFLIGRNLLLINRNHHAEHP